MQVQRQKYTAFLLLAIVVIGTGLRLYRLGDKGLWLDEAFSVWLGWHSVPEMISWIIRIDQHPPLYYFLLHFWLKFGDSTATARLFSAIVGSLTIPVMYLLGKHLLGRNAGLLAALILAISPFHVRFAQETRMYTLLTLTATLAILALAYLLTDTNTAKLRLGQQLVSLFQNRPWSSRVTTSLSVTQDLYGHNSALSQAQQSIKYIKTDLAWISYIVFTTATLLSHNTAIFFPVATNIVVFGLIAIYKSRSRHNDQHYPPSAKNWITAQLGVLLLWSAWLVPFIIQSIGVYREFWLSAPDYKTVVWTITNLISVFLPGQIPDQFEWTDMVWIVYGFIVLLGLFQLPRPGAHKFLLLTLFLTPFVGEWLVSLRRPIFYDRTLIWTSIPLYLLAAAGLIQLRFRPLILVAVLALLTVNTLSLREYFFVFEKEEWDKAATYVAERVEDQDLLLFNAPWVQIPFDFYYREFNLATQKHGVPADLFDRDVLEPKMMPDNLPRMRELIKGRERVWLVYSHYWYTDAQSLIPTALAEDLHLLDRQQFYGLEVHLYGLP